MTIIDNRRLSYNCCMTYLYFKDSGAEKYLETKELLAGYILVHMRTALCGH